MGSPFEQFLTHPVVLDTAGTIVYLGRLIEVSDSGFLLLDADVHDSRDGHATNEVYVNDARLNGVSPNRSRVLVLLSSVTSISLLSDVVEQ